jgi:hypothetical protein
MGSTGSGKTSVGMTNYGLVHKLTFDLVYQLGLAARIFLLGRTWDRGPQESSTRVNSLSTGDYVLCSSTYLTPTIQLAPTS